MNERLILCVACQPHQYRCAQIRLSRSEVRARGAAVPISPDILQLAHTAAIPVKGSGSQEGGPGPLVRGGA